MTISERIFKILKDKNMTQSEFAKRAGLSNTAVSDWKRKKTNPSADKIMDICHAIDVTPEQLLTGKGINDKEDPLTVSIEFHFDKADRKLIEAYHSLQDSQKKRLMAYIEALKKLQDLENL